MPPPDPVYILRGSRAPVTSLTYVNPCGQKEVLLSGDASGVVYAWDMKLKRVVASNELHSGKSVLWIEQSDDREIFTQGRDGKVRKCYLTESDIKSGDSSYLPSTFLTFCKCCFLKINTSTMLAVPSEIESKIDVYDLKSNKCVMELMPPKSENKFGMCMSITSKHADDETNAILIGYEDGSVALWDIRGAKILDRIRLHDESLMCLTYSSKINLGISGSVNKQIHTWSITSDDNKIGKLKTIATQISGVNQILMRSDNKLFVMAGWDGNVGVYGVKKLNPLAMLLCHSASVQTLAFSQDNLLACGSKDCSISLWDIYRHDR